MKTATSEVPNTNNEWVVFPRALLLDVVDLMQRVVPRSPDELQTIDRFMGHASRR